MPNPIDNLHSKNRHIQRLIDLFQYVWRRVDEERLTQVAGNITYTLILGIVPAVAVALAIFTRFPQFEMLQKMVEIYFTRGSISPSGLFR